MFEATCPACGGDGECVTSHRWRCHDCNGSGKITDKDKYDKLVEQERRCRAAFDARLSQHEYRRMGG